MITIHWATLVFFSVFGVIYAWLTMFFAADGWFSDRWGVGQIFALIAYLVVTVIALAVWIVMTAAGVA